MFLYLVIIQTKKLAQITKGLNISIIAFVQGSWDDLKGSQENLPESIKAVEAFVSGDPHR